MCARNGIELGGAVVWRRVCRQVVSMADPVFGERRAVADETVLE